MFKKGDVYKDFVVLNVFEVSDYHSVAFHILHKKTGLEIVHFLNDDEENLFSFSFRTPNPKSNGAAHIIEHSVLCGSENYPLKDPFVALSNQSVKTYLNAMTYPDRTVYPASSIVKADYFNLMSVYGDAVFFPRLDYEVFMQEAHRLEVADDGSVSIQGVVYNEMKGDYSSFDSAVSNACNASLLKNSVYEKDSGGDPLEIPSITHKELLDFHTKWYRPDNCLVFLYGNIPTEEQLDFIQTEFLDRLQKKYPQIDVSEEARQKRINEYLNYLTSEKVDSPVEFRCEGAKSSDSDEIKNTVVLNFKCDGCSDSESAIENTILMSVLFNHDGSPLQKALVESKLGDDISPQSGFSSYLYNSIVSFGLRGVKNGDEKKVEDLILKTLQKVVDEGVSKNDIDSTLMTLEYSFRSIKRIDGPYSKTLMGRIVYGWCYDFGVDNQIRSRQNLENVKEKIKTIPNFLETKIKNLLLDNQSRSLVIVTPTEDFNKKRNDFEKKIIDELLSKTTIEKVKADCEKLHAFQQKKDDTSCIPHLNPKDFIIDGKPRMNRIKTEIGEIDGIDTAKTGRKIPLIKNFENMNGIVVVHVGFPLDGLSPSDYPFVPSFSDALTDCGWTRRSDGKFLDWAESSEICALHTGGLSCMFITTEISDSDEAQRIAKERDWIGREWLLFKVTMLEEETENAMKILADCMTGVDFHDTKRLKDIAVESKNDFEASVIPDGYQFAELRAKCKSSKAAAVDEIWNGLSQLYTLKEIESADQEKIAEKYRKMYSTMKEGGAFIEIIAERSGFEKVNSLLPDFIKEVGLKSLNKTSNRTIEDYSKYTLLEGETENDFDEICVINSQVGFASEYFTASTSKEGESGIEDGCSHWLSNNLLWEKVRTIGGAYGAFSGIDTVPGGMTFMTFRDPNPLSSCDVFEECLKIASEMDFSEDEVIKTVVGDYSHWIQPQTPRSRGMSGLIMTLNGSNDIDRERKLMNLLEANPEKMKITFKRLYENLQRTDRIIKRRAVICGKNQLPQDTSSLKAKIVYLPI